MGFAFVHCILSPCLLSCPGSLVSRALCGVSWALVPPKVLYSFPIECLLALAHIIYASAYESIIVLNSPHKMQLTISVWKPWCCTTSNQSQQISPAQHLSMCNTPDCVIVCAFWATLRWSQVRGFVCYQFFHAQSEARHCKSSLPSPWKQWNILHKHNTGIPSLFSITGNTPHRNLDWILCFERRETWRMTYQERRTRASVTWKCWVSIYSWAVDPVLLILGHNRLNRLKMTIQVRNTLL